MAFRVPLFNLIVFCDFHKVLEDSRLASAAFLGKQERVVRLAVNLAFFLVILVVLFKHCGTDGTLEMLEVVLFAEGGDVRPTKHAVAFRANQIEPSKVIMFAKDERRAIFLSGWEELLHDGLLTVLQMRLGDKEKLTYMTAEAFEVIKFAKSTHKLPGYLLGTYRTRLVVHLT